MSTQKFVLIMGPTGAGKSNFIDCLLGGAKRSGDGLKSHTSDIGIYLDHGALAHLGHGPITVIDTPGFDDTKKSDLEILQTVADWMKQMYQDKEKISAIIYLHRITDNRVGGSVVKNLRMFGQLTGDASAKKVWMVTTMWDQPKINIQDAMRREAELERTFWNNLMSLGAHSRIRFFNKPDSAREIIKTALDSKEVAASAPLLLQEELEQLKKRLEETSAGKTLYNDLQKQLSDQRETLTALSKQAQSMQNEPAVRALRAQLDQVELDLQKTFDSIDQLKIPFFRKIFLALFSRNATSKAIAI